MSKITLHPLRTSRKYKCENNHDGRTCSACLRGGVHTLVSSSQQYQQVFAELDTFAVVTERDMIMKSLLNNNNSNKEEEQQQENEQGDNNNPLLLSFRWLMFCDYTNYVKANQSDVSQMLIVPGADPLPPLLQANTSAFSFTQSSIEDANAILLAPLLQPLVAEDSLFTPSSSASAAAAAAAGNNAHLVMDPILSGDQDASLELAAKALADLADLCSLVGCDRPLHLVQGQCLTLSGTCFFVEQTDPPGCIVRLCDETDVALAEPIGRPNELFAPTSSSSSSSFPSTSRRRSIRQFSVSVSPRREDEEGEDEGGNDEKSGKKKSQNNLTSRKESSTSPRRGLVALAADITPPPASASSLSALSSSSSRNHNSNNKNSFLSNEKEFYSRAPNIVSRDVALSPIQFGSNNTNNDNNNNSTMILNSPVQNQNQQQRQQQQQRKQMQVGRHRDQQQEHINNSNVHHQSLSFIVDEESLDDTSWLSPVSAAVSSPPLLVASAGDNNDPPPPPYSPASSRRSDRHRPTERRRQEDDDEEERRLRPHSWTERYEELHRLWKIKFGQRFPTPVHLVAQIQRTAEACNQLMATNNDIVAFLTRSVNATFSQLLYPAPTKVQLLLVMCEDAEATCLALDMDWRIPVVECWSCRSLKLLYVAVPKAKRMETAKLLQDPRGVVVHGEPRKVTKLDNCFSALDDLDRMLTWQAQQFQDQFVSPLLKSLDWMFVMETFGSQIADLAKDVRSGKHKGGGLSLKQQRLEQEQGEEEQQEGDESNVAFSQVEEALILYRREQEGKQKNNPSSFDAKMNLERAVAHFSNAVAHEISSEQDMKIAREVLDLWRVFEQLGNGYELVVSQLESFKTKLLVSQLTSEEVFEHTLRSRYQEAVSLLRCYSTFQSSSSSAGGLNMNARDQERNEEEAAKSALDRLVQAALEVDVFTGEKVGELHVAEAKCFNEYLSSLREVEF